MIKILKLIYSFFLPLFYKKKDYNLVIMRFDGNKFMFNTKVFFEYLLKNSTYNVKYIINNDQYREQLIKKYGNYFITDKTLKDIMLISKAGIWLTDGGFPLKTPFRHKNRVLINFWHGMPIKYIGLDGYKGLSKLRVFLQLKMFSKHYNAFCVTSSNFKSIFSKSFLISEKKIKVLGQPRDDLLFKKNDKKQILNSLFNDLPKYDKIILYAPTYRSSNYGANKLNSTKFFPFNDFDIGKIEKFLEKNNYIIFIRSHHLDKINFKETNRIRFLNNDKVDEIFEILNIFDLLISDYSGMIYDYLLTDNPMMFLPYDIDEYTDNAGIYFDYNFVAPGPKPKTQKEFLGEIQKLLSDKNYYLKERKCLKKFVYSIEENNCKRILDYLKKEIKQYER